MSAFQGAGRRPAGPATAPGAGAVACAVALSGTGPRATIAPLPGAPMRRLALALAASIAAAPAEGAEARRPVDPDRVVPILEVRAPAGPGGRRPAAPPAAGEEHLGDLRVAYAEATAADAAPLSEQELVRAGLPPAGRRARAVRNLKRLLLSVDLQGGDGVYLVTADGAHEATLVLDDGLWSGEGLAAKVKGEVVVAIPARDVLLVTGSEDEAGLARVRAAARRVMTEGTHTLTEQLFVRRGGRFVPFDGT